MALESQFLGYMSSPAQSMPPETDSYSILVSQLFLVGCDGCSGKYDSRVLSIVTTNRYD
jgi:hypothetical protein